MAHRSKALPSTAALRTFETAARHLSFTGAAVELNQTQGAVSHQIRELETRLGVKLFEREARGIVLTESGRIYLPFVQESLDRLRAGDEALRPSTVEHILTVSCSPNFAQKWLVPRLGAFIADHPDIDLRISATPQHITFAEEGIDMAVRHGQGNWPQLAVTRLCQESIFPVCSPYLIAPFTQTLPIRDLSQYVLIHDQNRANWASWLEQQNADVAAFDLERGPVFSQTSLAIDAAIAGQGIALARSALAELDLAAGRLLRPVAEEILAEFAYWIVYPKRYASRPNIQRFQAWLLQQPDGHSA